MQCHEHTTTKRTTKQIQQKQNKKVHPSSVQLSFTA